MFLSCRTSAPRNPFKGARAPDSGESRGREVIGNQDQILAHREVGARGVTSAKTGFTSEHPHYKLPNRYLVQGYMYSSAAKPEAKALKM